MRIGLWNLEPWIINSAMMRVSRWHKDRGDEVETYEKWKGWQYYDKIYVFSIFTFTEKKDIPPNAICGGTGFDLTTTLPKEIEDSDYDWSLYPKCDFSLVWFSIGCIYQREKHPYCVVVDKEGCIQPVQPKNLNPNGKWIRVMDNNFFANPEWRNAIEYLHEWKQPVHIEQGIDVRLLNDEMCEAINSLKRYEKQHKFAWDDPRENLLPKIEWLVERIKPYKLGCFVLIGYWSTEKQDLMRVEALRKLEIDPFAMPFNKSDAYQRGFARYVNMKAEFKSQTWQEYKDRKVIPDGATEGNKHSILPFYVQKSLNKY